MQPDKRLLAEAPRAPDRKLALELYRQLVLARRAEARLVELWEQGLVPGRLCSGLGQEALAVGAVSALRPSDFLVPSHRGIGHCLARGMRPSGIFAEYLGRQDGCSHGKGGTNLADRRLGVLGLSGTPGSGAVVAAGAALSAQVRGTDQVALCFFGEGTSNRGPIHEAMNLASVWKLPCIFVCENNGYSMGTPQRCTMAITDVAERARGYGMPSWVVDGNDVLEVYEVTQRAVIRARSGEGPTLIEGKTYRWRGHWEGDPGIYRPSEEVEVWRQRCPVQTFREVLLGSGLLSEEEASALENEVAAEIEKETESALRSPFPPPLELARGVFSQPIGID